MGFVHAPDMDMVNVKDAIKLRQMLRYFVYVYAAGHFFKKKLKYLPKTLDGVYKDKYKEEK